MTYRTASDRTRTLHLKAQGGVGLKIVACATIPLLLALFFPVFFQIRCAGTTCETLSFRVVQGGRHQSFAWPGTRLEVVTDDSGDVTTTSLRAITPSGPIDLEVVTDDDARGSRTALVAAYEAAGRSRTPTFTDGFVAGIVPVAISVLLFGVLFAWSMRGRRTTLVFDPVSRNLFVRQAAGPLGFGGRMSNVVVSPHHRVVLDERNPIDLSICLVEGAASVEDPRRIVLTKADQSPEMRAEQRAQIEALIAGG